MTMIPLMAIYTKTKEGKHLMFALFKIQRLTTSYTLLLAY